jgi:hypothetical protein
MTWQSKNDVADDVASVCPRRAPRLATPSGHTVWPPVGHPVGHSVWPRRAPRLGTPSGYPVWPPVAHPVWPHRLATRRAPRLATPSGHPSGTPSGPVGHSVWPRRAPRLGTPSSHPVGHPVWHPFRTPSGTPALSRGSGRPSISEPLNRCPFGPPTVALPFTYIKPSNPPLHHFLHSPICIGTCDCVATAALRGSWSLGAGSNCLGANPSSFFSSIYIGEGWSLILSSLRMTVPATVTAREEEEEGAGSG